MKLSGNASFRGEGGPVLAIVEGEPDCLLLRPLNGSDPRMLRLSISSAIHESDADVSLDREFGYLAPGDIVRLSPRTRQIRVLYRKNSRHNTLFFTERCNSRCVMCSQPPREVDDSYLIDEILTAIPWMARETPELGITGGEPTLLGQRLVDVIEATERNLPATALHVLSNGRLLARLAFAEQIAQAHHHDLMFGIPLYSDIASEHDFVVQAKGAYEETVYGILNLARVDVRIEIRIVIHRYTYARLAQTAGFIARNLPFVSQVVLMGLEPVGFAKSNLDALWIDPLDYQEQLSEAVQSLDDAGIPVFIYNHPLCVLPKHLHRFSRKSISDWKNIYLPPCECCAEQKHCGGLFASAARRQLNRLPIAGHST